MSHREARAFLERSARVASIAKEMFVNLADAFINIGLEDAAPSEQRDGSGAIDAGDRLRADAALTVDHLSYYLMSRGPTRRALSDAN